MSNSTEKSTILLLCLGSDPELTVQRQPTTADLLRIFKQFGDLFKVIIFSKKQVLKSFLEFNHMSSAEKARNALNDRLIEDFGRAKLYFSALQELENSNRYLDFWQSDSPKPKETSPIRKPLQPLSVLSNVSTDERITASPKQIVPWMKEQQVLGKKPGLIHDFFSKLDLNQDRENLKIEPSSVLLISNLDSEFSNARELFNLFSCFGYISKLLMMKNLRKALIEFRLVEQAKNALNNINSQDFPTFKIKANYSKYPKIDLKKNNKSENSQQFNEVIIPSQSQNRISEMDYLNKMNISRSLLIVAQTSIGSAKFSDIYSTVQSIATPSNLKQINESDDHSDLLQFRFDFSDSEKAVQVLTKLHGSFIKATPLSVSFFY